MNTVHRRLESCVTPEGKFIYGIHKPSYQVTNLRQNSRLETLGLDNYGTPVKNSQNFPNGEIGVENADWIFEIPNPLPFKGRTFIDKEWADASAKEPERIRIPSPQDVSLNKTLADNGVAKELITKLPPPLLLALATSSTDRNDLIQLAEISCELTRHDNILGLCYTKGNKGNYRAVIHDHSLFEAVANNPSLPDEYKIAMVIRPGAQGGSEIVGEWSEENSKGHVYEYLRKNSYIAGGHYAANMAEDAVRYSIDTLTEEDMHGLRHLYYQRTFIRLAKELNLTVKMEQKSLTEDKLESLRLQIIDTLATQPLAAATLWGWNFGFDYAPTRYRLHASHQQIHQQYALVPDQVAAYNRGTTSPVGTISAYSSGDLVADVISRYHKEYQSDFFADYRKAIGSNSRMDERQDLPANLVVWSDENSMLFVPKAQTSQWELQLMTLPDNHGNLAGSVVECDASQRKSLNKGILMAQKALAGLGAKMVTSIEYPKRLHHQPETGQPLLYAFLPRLPESPGAFSEAQLRFINGHYPEDFAKACRGVIH